MEKDLFGVGLSSFIEKEAVAFNEAHELLFLTSLKGPMQDLDEIARDSRAPIDLIAVIDKSGSMSGGKLDLVLRTMDFVIDQLKEQDQFCIVSYHTTVDLSLPMTLMNPQGKETAKQTLSTIKPLSSTNLSGGLLKALDQIEARKVKNEVVSVMLFTDGRANVGLTKGPQIAKALQERLDKIDAVCTIFTFGYGADHDQEMLKEIAEAGGGLYYFIEGLQDIPESFSDCLGGLLSVVAQKITLNIEGVGGITVKKVLSRLKGQENVSGAQVELHLGDIYAEEARDIIVAVNIPAVDLPIDEFTPAVNVKLSYIDVTTNKQEVRHVTAYIKRPFETPADQPINLNIDRQRNRLTTADAMERSSLINKSDKDATMRVKAILEAAIKSIESSATAEDRICIGLIQELQDSIRDLREKDYSVAQKKIMTRGVTHAKQRGGTSYENISKVNMKVASQSIAYDVCDCMVDEQNDLMDELIFP